MGNVNAREEEANSNHHQNDDNAATEISSHHHQASDFAAPMGGHQSPPHSPRATQSPLMFAPQVLFSLSPQIQTFGWNQKRSEK